MLSLERPELISNSRKLNVCHASRMSPLGTMTSAHDHVDPARQRNEVRKGFLQHPSHLPVNMFGVVSVNTHQGEFLPRSNSAAVQVYVTLLDSSLCGMLRRRVHNWLHEASIGANV
jgi:hypothetical protein